MTSIYDLYETDGDLEMNGVTLDCGDAGKFKIARAGGKNQKFNLAVRAALKPYQRQLEQSKLGEEKLAELLARPYAEHVLRGWEGVRGRDGKELVFSVETAVKLLGDLPGLFAEIRDQAGKLDNYRKQEIEEVVKN